MTTTKPKRRARPALDAARVARQAAQQQAYDDWVASNVASMPPLSDAQYARLAAILRPLPEQRS